MPTVPRRAEQRHCQRRSVLIPARIRLAPGVYLPCTVLDISPMGAGLKLDYASFVPMQFRLQIPDDLFEVDCALRHRREAHIGVEFLSARAEAMARYG